MHKCMIYLLLLLATTSCGLLQTKKVQFLPANNLKPGNYGQSNVTEEYFYEVIDIAEGIYAPIIAAQGGILVINPLWDDPTVNASASQRDQVWEVNMYGGLARRPETTVDAFTIVLCHEIGHHLAGFPFVEDWAANEGQSDYYSTQVCIKKIFAETNNSVDAPAIAYSLCGNAPDLDLCVRAMMGAKATATLLAALNNERVDFDTPDTSITRQTRDQHPNAQCRLDTMMAGILCSKAWDDLFIPQTQRDTESVSCTGNRTGDAFQDILQGLKPRCWYAP